MGTSPDYVRLATDVLGIRNAPPALAKRLVDQALVVEDRREEWLRRGEQLCQAAPQAAGVYVLRDADARPLYVGKANNLRRRLRTHFAARRWRQLKADFARATDVEWQVVGSEIEALIREAVLIRALVPAVNVQVGEPQMDTRAVPDSLRRDTVIVLPSSVENAVELLAVRASTTHAPASGAVLFVRVPRDGKGLRARVDKLWKFFTAPRVDEPAALSSPSLNREGDGFESRDDLFADACAPLVWSWLAGRGASATRLDPRDTSSAREFERRVRVVLRDARLFADRIVVLRSEFRSTSSRP